MKRNAPRPVIEVAIRTDLRDRHLATSLRSRGRGRGPPKGARSLAPLCVCGLSLDQPAYRTSIPPQLICSGDTQRPDARLCAWALAASGGFVKMPRCAARFPCATARSRTCGRMSAHGYCSIFSHFAIRETRRGMAQRMVAPERDYGSGPRRGQRPQLTSQVTASTAQCVAPLGGQRNRSYPAPSRLAGAWT